MRRERISAFAASLAAATTTPLLYGGVEMLAFAAEHGIGAEVEPAPMADVNGALHCVRRGGVRYRRVLAN